MSSPDISVVIHHCREKNKTAHTREFTAEPGCRSVNCDGRLQLTVWIHDFQVIINQSCPLNIQMWEDWMETGGIKLACTA